MEYKSIEEISSTFTVRDQYDNLTELDQEEPQTGKTTLGVFLSPNGNNKEMIKELRDKTEEWAKSTKEGRLNPTEAWLSLETTIIKSVEYPLPALTLTEKECKYIMAPALKAGLNASHISNTFPRDVLYGGKKEGGLNLDDIYYSQGISHLQILQQHIDQPTITGDLLRESIEAATLELGYSKNFFLLPFNIFSRHLTECWIENLWKFASDNTITIQNHVTPKLQPERENDIFIMEDIINLGNFGTTDLKRINACRLYLQVTTLSDITEGNGTKINKAYKCIKDEERSSPYLWPNQPRPGPLSRILWKTALKTCLQIENKILHTPLGRWLKTPHQWKWFYNPTSQRLIQHKENQWKIWRRSGRGQQGSRPKFKYLCNSLSQPTNLYPETVERYNDTLVIFTGHASIQRQEMNPNLPPKWGDPSIISCSVVCINLPSLSWTCLFLCFHRWMINSHICF